MDTLFNWDLILQLFEIALALGLITGAGAIVRKIYIYLTRSTIDKVLVRKYSVYDIMQQVLSQVDGDRMLLIKVHNGGATPKVTSILKSTIVQEVFHQPLGSIKMDWQDREVDIAYIKMLIELDQSKEHQIILRTATMDDSMLKTTYEGHGVAMSCLHFIAREKKAMYFVSVNCTKEKEITPFRKTRMDDLAVKLKALI